MTQRPSPPPRPGGEADGGPRAATGPEGAGLAAASLHAERGRPRAPAARASRRGGVPRLRPPRPLLPLSAARPRGPGHGPALLGAAARRSPAPLPRVRGAAAAGGRLVWGAAPRALRRDVGRGRRGVRHAAGHGHEPAGVPRRRAPPGRRAGRCTRLRGLGTGGLLRRPRSLPRVARARAPRRACGGGGGVGAETAALDVQGLPRRRVPWRVRRWCCGAGGCVGLAGGSGWRGGAVLHLTDAC